MNFMINELFTQMIKPRIRPILQEAYKDIKYVLDEDEYHEQEADDNFAKRFVSGFYSLIKIYQVNLNQIIFNLINNYICN